MQRMKKALLQLHLAVFLAGFTAILGKLILLNEALLVWYRLLLTVLILGGLMLWKKQLVRMSLNDLAKIGGVGFVIAFHWVCFYGSIKYANISVSLVCLSAAGFFTAIIEPLLLRQRLVPAELMMGIMAIAGIYIIFDFHPQYKTGMVFGILSAFGSSLFPIFNKQLLKRFSPRVLTLYELTFGLAVLGLIIPLYLHNFPAGYLWPSIVDWGWLFVLASVCTVYCFDLQLRALKKVSAFTCNLTYNLEPVYGILLAFLIFKESKMLHREFYIGLSLIILAIVLQMVRVLWQPKRNVFVT